MVTPRSLLSRLPLFLGLTLAACSSGSTSTDADIRDSGDLFPDLGLVDLGPPDMGTTDQGTPDAGEMDLGEADMGAPDMGPATPFPRLSCAAVTGTCVSFEEGQEGEFIDAINLLSDDTTVILGAGTFVFDNAVTVRGADNITLVGQGIDVTVLDFSTQMAQSNGVDVIGDNFTIEQLTITDAKKDGLRIEDSTDVVIRFVKVTWANGPATENGAYGIYPVRCTNVLLEDSEGYNASDAGLYIGQSINVIVRRNKAMGNVAGLEIENTQFADVYENIVEDNTGGLLVFDLPGNPVVGRDVKIHDNIIRANNRANFARSGTVVSQIPAGTGTFALASRRVEINNNTYENNNSTDIALLSGLLVNASTTAWSIPNDQIVGDIMGLNLPSDGQSVANFGTGEIWIHDNTHMGGGTLPDGADENARPIGALLAVVYFFNGNGPIDTILYDGIGEMVDPMEAMNNTNNNRICVENETDGTFATLDLLRLQAMIAMNDLPDTSDIYRPAAPFAPFDCTGFTAGPIPAITLP